MFTSRLRLVPMITWIGCLAFVLSTSFVQEPQGPPVSSPKRTVTSVEKPDDTEEDGEQLPSASQVIEKYIMAMGGYEFLSSIESAHFVFKGTSSNGTTIESEYYQSRGRYYCEMLRNNLSIVRGVWSDGTTDDNGLRTGFAWQYVNDGALTQKMGDELQEYLRRRSRVISSPHWETDFKSIKCIAKTTVRGKPVWQLRFVDHDGKEVDRYFDIETGYCLRRKTMESFDGGTFEVVREYMNHEKRGDYVIAVNETIEYRGILERWHVESFEYDVEIPEELFAVPKSIQHKIFTLQQKQAEDAVVKQEDDDASAGDN